MNPNIFLQGNDADDVSEAVPIVPVTQPVIETPVSIPFYLIYFTILIGQCFCIR